MKNRFNQSEEKTKEADCLEKYVEIGFGQTVKIVIWVKISFLLIFVYRIQLGKKNIEH